MMELMKNNIHMNRQKGTAVSQITLDDDFIKRFIFRTQ